jgi:hypothetical protein
MAYLGRQELPPLGIGGWKMPANAVHLAFHLMIGSVGLAAHHWTLKKESTV